MLGTPRKWDHIGFVCVWLISLGVVFRVRPWCSLCGNFIASDGRTICHCMNVSVCYPLTCGCAAVNTGTRESALVLFSVLWSPHLSHTVTLCSALWGTTRHSSHSCCTILIHSQQKCTRTSSVAQLVKNLPAMQETRVRPLGGEDPLEKGVATHSSVLAWRSP